MLTRQKKITDKNRNKMKKSIFNTKSFAVMALTALFFTACENKMVEIKEVETSLKTIQAEQGIFDLMESGINSKGLNNKSDTLSFVQQYVCGTIEIPKILKDLNRNEVYSSNISLQVNSSLQAYGFSGTMGKKDVLIIAYLTKFKDYTCEGKTKRVQVGLKLYVHASDLKVKVASPSLGIIAAATELGLAKARYKFETFGINPDDFYTKLPSAQFTVDTYAKVISAYDNIVHSLNDSTEIDPIITDLPK